MQDTGADLNPMRFFTEADLSTPLHYSTGRSYLSEWLEEQFPLRWMPVEKLSESDYLFVGDFGYTYEKFNGVRIFITGERHAPNLSLYDYCLTHSLKQNDRCLYFPYWFHRILFAEEYAGRLDERPDLTVEELRAQNREFCNFICRNSVCRARNHFVKHLSKRKRVNCPGPFMHNTDFQLGAGIVNKLNYQARHLFSVAYENEASPGYTTEKILDALVSRTIPIYWGDPCVEETFNPDAFIHARRFKNEKALINYVIDLSQDLERCVQMLNAPIFLNPNIIEEKTQALHTFMEAIVTRGPVIRRTRWQRFNGFLSNYYGHGLFRTLRRVSRAVRGKKIGVDGIVTMVKR